MALDLPRTSHKQIPAGRACVGEGSARTVSIQKRTVSEPHEAQFVVCDGPECSRSIATEDWRPDGNHWMTVAFEQPEYDEAEGMYAYIPRHFCSYGCLALWAEQRAMPRAVDVQP